MKNKRKPDGAFFLVLAICIALMMVIFFLIIAIPICGDARGAIGLTAIPAMGLAATYICYYRSCEYEILAVAQRKARALQQSEPDPPAHAFKAYFENNEDAEVGAA